MKFQPSIFFFYCLLYSANGLNLVFYMTVAAKSHVSFFGSLMNTLQERGHTVDAVIAYMNPTVDWSSKLKPRNFTLFEFPGESPWLSAKHYLNPFEEQPRFQFDHYYETSLDLCKIGLSSGEPLEFLKNGKYDAMISSSYDHCGLILAHQAGIKSVMTMSSLNLLPHETIDLGLPNPVSCVADNFDSLRGSFSLFAKIWRVYETFVFRRTYSQFLKSQTAMARNYFGLNFPSVQELIDKIDVVFVNSNEVIEIPRTISHKVQYIGGIALPKPKRLSKEFTNLLSQAYKGTVLVSFGTQVASNLVEYRVRKAFAYAFSKFPEYNFIFKHDVQPGDLGLFENVTNVEFVKWLPQTDLLYDTRVVAFITHAGLNSLLEASYAGVPMVSIPLFADQMHNTRAGVRLGTTIELHKVHFDGKDLENAMKSVLHNQRIRQRSSEISILLKNRPNNPKTRFIEWVEFAASNPGFHKSVNLSEARIGFVEYYGFDIMLVISIFVIVTFLLVRIVCRNFTPIGFKTGMYKLKSQ